jgi:hypothetical protein
VAERVLDMHEVGGSSPPAPTPKMSSRGRQHEAQGRSTDLRSDRGGCDSSCGGGSTFPHQELRRRVPAIPSAGTDRRRERRRWGRLRRRLRRLPLGLGLVHDRHNPRVYVWSAAVELPVPREGLPGLRETSEGSGTGSRVSRDGFDNRPPDVEGPFRLRRRYIDERPPWEVSQPSPRWPLVYSKPD